MDHFKKERIINQIVWGNLITSIGNIVFILSPPSPEDKAMSSIIYEEEYCKAIKYGVMAENELLVSLIENNKWSLSKESRISGIKDDMQKITRGLLDLIFNRNKLEQARLMLRKAESSLLELLTEKNSLLSNSAENYALLNQQRYIISRITKNSKREMFWLDAIAFDECTNLSLVCELCDLFFSKSRLSSKITREIARSQPWRNIWASAKSSGNPFGKPQIEWTDNQLELVSWSQIYDMAYESFERPNREIIEDDDLLDSWFLRQSDKVENKAKNDIVGSKIKENNKPGRKEIFVITDKEGSKQVYDSNDIQAKGAIKAKQIIINRDGHLKDQDSPESQLEMRGMLMDQIRDKAKDIRRR